MWCTPTTSLQHTSWLVPHNFLLTDMSRLLKTSYKSSDRFFKQTKYHLWCYHNYEQDVLSWHWNTPFGTLKLDLSRKVLLHTIAFQRGEKIPPWEHNFILEVCESFLPFEKSDGITSCVSILSLAFVWLQVILMLLGLLIHCSFIEKPSRCVST